MLEALICFLLIYALFVFINWLLYTIKKDNTNKPTVMPHKRIARTIWIYCALLISVITIMVNFDEFDRFERPRYGDDNVLYIPYGRYSNLRIGNIREETEFLGNKFDFKIMTIFLGRNWEELPNDEPYSPYKYILSTFHTYDNDCNSNTYGRGIILRIFDLDYEIPGTQNDEKSVYKNVIDSLVSDSSFYHLYHLSNNFSPYTAIETNTYAMVSEEDDSPVLFKKHITIFANKRAYEFNFYVDKEVERPEGSNTFYYLDEEFINVAKELDLYSYKKWQEQKPQYLSNLKIKSAIFMALYIICIIGAISIAFLYFKNIGSVNTKSAKVTKVLSIVNFVVFLILGIGCMTAFCSIHYHENPLYKFVDYIDNEYAAYSILCYGVYVILLVITTNRFYIKSYSQPKAKSYTKIPKQSFIYWLVRPAVLITKLISKITKAIRDEYNKQISDNK